MTTPTTNAESELKSCPFCGSMAEIYNPFHMLGRPSQPATYHGGVRCRECGCATKATTPPDAAIAAWNRRTPAAERAVRDRVIKECAEVCYEYAIDQWNLYKGRTPYTGRESGRADPDVQGRSDGAEVCAERIRALKTSPNEDE